jgi:hypothetical protein
MLLLKLFHLANLDLCLAKQFCYCLNINVLILACLSVIRTISFLSSISILLFLVTCSAISFPEYDHNYKDVFTFEFTVGRLMVFCQIYLDGVFP